MKDANLSGRKLDGVRDLLMKQFQQVGWFTLSASSRIEQGRSIAVSESVSCLVPYLSSIFKFLNSYFVNPDECRMINLCFVLNCKVFPGKHLQPLQENNQTKPSM